MKTTGAWWNSGPNSPSDSSVGAVWSTQPVAKTVASRRAAELSKYAFVTSGEDLWFVSRLSGLVVGQASLRGGVYSGGGASVGHHPRREYEAGYMGPQEVAAVQHRTPASACQANATPRSKRLATSSTVAMKEPPNAAGTLRASQLRYALESHPQPVSLCPILLCTINFLRLDLKGTHEYH